MKNQIEHRKHGAAIVLGRDQFSMLNPPDHELLLEGEKLWRVGRAWNGSIALRDGVECHPFFRQNDVFMAEFVQWINDQKV